MGVNKFLEDPLNVCSLSAFSKDLFANVMLFVSQEILCNASQKVLASKDDAVVI